MFFNVTHLKILKNMGGLGTRLAVGGHKQGILDRLVLIGSRLRSKPLYRDSKIQS